MIPPTAHCMLILLSTPHQLSISNKCHLADPPIEHPALGTKGLQALPSPHQSLPSTTPVSNCHPQVVLALSDFSSRLAYRVVARCLLALSHPTTMIPKIAPLVHISESSLLLSDDQNEQQTDMFSIFLLTCYDVCGPHDGKKKVTESILGLEIGIDKVTYIFQHINHP